jgi:hypothetical protein
VGVLSRLRAIGRLVVPAITWPFRGEIEHSRPTPEEAEQQLREIMLANRDQSRSA